jgi:hypothetical protein
MCLCRHKKLNKLLKHINVGDGPTSERTEINWTVPGKQHGGGLPHTNVGLESNVSKLFQDGISHPELTVKQCFIFQQIQASPLIFEQRSPSPDTRAMAYGSWRPPLPRAVILPSTKDRMKKTQFTVAHCVLTFLVFVQEMWAGTIKNWTYVPPTILIPSQCLVIGFSLVDDATWGNLRRQATYHNVIFRSVRVTIVAAIQQQVLALVIRHSKCMHRIMTPVACLTLQYFPHYLGNGTIFKEKRLLNIKCVLIFSTNLSGTFLILRRILQDITKNVHGSSWRVAFILVRLPSNFNFLDSFSELLKYQTSWKIRPWEPTCSIRTYRRTDRHDEADSRFPHFRNAPKNVQLWRHCISIYSNSLYSSVPPTFLLADPSWFRKITTDSHILAHVTIVCPDDGYPK